MDQVTLVAVLDALANLGALGAAGLVIYGFLTERLVPKARLDEMRRDRQDGVTHAREAMDRFERVEAELERLRQAIERR